VPECGIKAATPTLVNNCWIIPHKLAHRTCETLAGPI
jgi:hypothetical protein